MNASRPNERGSPALDTNKPWAVHRTLRPPSKLTLRSHPELVFPSWKLRTKTVASCSRTFEGQSVSDSGPNRLRESARLLLGMEKRPTLVGLDACASYRSLDYRCDFPIRWPVVARRLRVDHCALCEFVCVSHNTGRGFALTNSSSPGGRAGDRSWSGVRRDGICRHGGVLVLGP